VCNTYSIGNLHEDLAVFHYGYLHNGPDPSLLFVDDMGQDGSSIETEVSRLEKVMQGLLQAEDQTIPTLHGPDEEAYRLITGLRRRRLLALELELGRLQAMVQSSGKTEL